MNQNAWDLERSMRDHEVRNAWQESVARYGFEHTHDFDCVTWRGQNWPGACNCSLSDRSEEVS